MCADLSYRSLQKRNRKEMQSHPTDPIPSYLYLIAEAETGRFTCEVARRKPCFQLGKAMKKPWRTCREVVALISAREDRTLSAKESVVLRFHVFICVRCTRWEQHVSLMRKGVSAWKNYKD